MKDQLKTGRDAAWEKIEEERRRDRLIRRVGYIAWSVTIFVMLIYTTIVALEFVRTLEMQRVGVVSGLDVIAVVMPLIKGLGVFSLLIAILATVGVFLRLRTASLSEIQLRLAALEEMLLDGAKGDS